MGQAAKKHGHQLQSKQYALLQAEGTSIMNAYSVITHLPKELDAKAFAAERGRFETATKTAQDAHLALRQARSDEKAEAKKLRKMIKRVRGAVLGIYGDDSKELELVGIKRSSERRRPTRQPKKKATVEVTPSQPKTA